jgi:ketopantoate reductase
MEVSVLGPDAVGTVTAARLASQNPKLIGVDEEVR